MSDCVLWTRSRNPAGYGNRWDKVKKSYRGAHVMAYEESFGPVPEGFYVCHTCDTPSCVNPEHLVAGSPSFNSSDMFRKKRDRLTGERSTIARFSDEDVRQIRCLRALGISLGWLISTFGISRVYLWQLLNNKRRHGECIQVSPTA